MRSVAIQNLNLGGVGDMPVSPSRVESGARDNHTDQESEMIDLDEVFSDDEEMNLDDRIPGGGEG